MKPSPIDPADFATLRSLLGLTQFRMGVLMGTSQASIAKFERGEISLPKKAHAPLSVIRQGYPATPENGNRLVAARTRLNVSMDALAAALNLPVADYELMEEGETAIPWSVFMPLTAIEWKQGFPPTFDPAEDAARYLTKSALPLAGTDLNLFSRLDATATRFTSREERERLAQERSDQEDREVDARNAAGALKRQAEAAKRREREARELERERARREREANAPTPTLDDEDDDTNDDL